MSLGVNIHEQSHALTETFFSQMFSGFVATMNGYNS